MGVCPVSSVLDSFSLRFFGLSAPTLVLAYIFFKPSGNSEPFVFFPVLPGWLVSTPCRFPCSRAPGLKTFCGRPQNVLFLFSFPHENGFCLFPAPLCDFFTSLLLPLLVPLYFLSCFFSRTSPRSALFPVLISPKMRKKPPAISQTFFLRFCRRFPVPGMLFSPGASQTIFSFWRGGVNTPVW